MDRYVSILRAVAERAGLPPIKQLAAQPGVKAVYRATLHHVDFHAADAVVTLRCVRPDDALLESIYVGHFGHKPLSRRLPDAEHAQFVRALQVLQFDTLPDQPSTPVHARSLCWVERAAGGFWHGVIFSPQSTTGRYALLLAALQTYLPEAFREVK